MTDELTVSPGERGIVRVFDLALERDEAEAFADDPKALAHALGVDDLNAHYVDVFPVSRLAGMSLADYLADGHGIPPGAFDDHAAALNGLTGHVAVVTSGAFGEGGQTLAVAPPLRHVATLAEDSAAARFGELPSDSARRTPAPASEPPAAAREGRPYKPHHIVAGVILVIFVLGIVLFGGFV